MQPKENSIVRAHRASSGRNIPALDGVRAFAILLVMAFHCTLAVRTSVWGAWLARIPTVGWCGVDLFFVLSGFLITGILLDSKVSPRYFQNFYIRRALRILPLYYGSLLLLFVGMRTVLGGQH